MYELISVTRSELEINTSFYKTKEEAQKAMIEDIMLMTGYKNLNEFREDAADGSCGYYDDGAWAETSQFGTAQWNIVKIPTTL